MGGPAVTAPSHTSFGHLVIDGMIARSLNARVDIKFATTGLEWVASIPMEHLELGGSID